MRARHRRLPLFCIAAALWLALAGCGPRHDTIIIRAEDGMPPTRVPAEQVTPAPPIATVRPQAYPPPGPTSTRTVTPTAAAYP
jgi:hypothetical protein